LRSTTLKIWLEQLPSTYPGIALTFRIKMQNTWRERLALFFPETEWLCFTQPGMGKHRQWLNGMFVSACEFAFTIEPFASREFVFQARYVDHCPELADADFDLQRYTIDLPSGRFDVQYRYTIGGDYYNGDTHTRVSDLIEYASANNAHAWTGEVVSNRLTIDRDNPPQMVG
jgi:hypothetical protein